MKNIGGVWLPDGETHLVDWMTKTNHRVGGKLTYQYHKLDAALKYVEKFRAAIDVGAHCGLWSMHLVKWFEVVHAFEPVQAHRECFQANVPKVNRWTAEERAAAAAGGIGAVHLHACALGERDGMVKIHTAPSSSGDSWVDGDGDIPMRRLDDFLLEHVDFLKLDCEGYELFALRGGEELLKRCRPVVCVEQKPGRAEKFGLPQTGAVDYLQGLGAKLRREISGDYIMSWDA